MTELRSKTLTMNVSNPTRPNDTTNIIRQSYPVLNEVYDGLVGLKSRSHDYTFEEMEEEVYYSAPHPEEEEVQYDVARLSPSSYLYAEIPHHNEVDFQKEPLDALRTATRT